MIYKSISKKNGPSSVEFLVEPLWPHVHKSTNSFLGRRTLSQYNSKQPNDHQIFEKQFLHRFHSRSQNKVTSRLVIVHQNRSGGQQVGWRQIRFIRPALPYILLQLLEAETLSRESPEYDVTFYLVLHMDNAGQRDFKTNNRKNVDSGELHQPLTSAHFLPRSGMNWLPISWIHHWELPQNLV